MPLVKLVQCRGMGGGGRSDVPQMGRRMMRQTTHEMVHHMARLDDAVCVI